MLIFATEKILRHIIAEYIVVTSLLELVFMNKCCYIATMVVAFCTLVCVGARAQSTEIDYGIVVNSVNITSSNAHDVTGDGITGSISYDPNTLTLTLNNVNLFMIDAKGMSTDLVINLVGNNVITCCLYVSYLNTVITGSGSLNIGYIECRVGPNNDPCHLAINSTTVYVNCDHQYYNWGLYGYSNEFLTIVDATVKTFGLDCALGDFQNIDLMGVEIVAPYGATITDGYIRIGSTIVNDTILIQPIVQGVEQATEKLDLTVFPNPTTEILNIKMAPTAEAANMNIVDAQGRTIAAVGLEANRTDYTVDVNGLAAGVYYINVRSGNTLQTASFVKK